MKSSATGSLHALAGAVCVVPSVYIDRQRRLKDVPKDNASCLETTSRSQRIPLGTAKNLISARLKPAPTQVVGKVADGCAWQMLTMCSFMIWDISKNVIRHDGFASFSHERWPEGALVGSGTMSGAVSKDQNARVIAPTIEQAAAAPGRSTRVDRSGVDDEQPQLLQLDTIHCVCTHALRPQTISVTGR